MEKIETIQIDYEYYLTEAEIHAIEHEVGIMETAEAAGIEALKAVQQVRGWISDDSLYAVSDLLQVPVAQLEEVATFYNLIYRQPVGHYVIHLCDSISCHLLGYQSVYKAISRHFNIEYGQTSEDGVFTLLSNACLGACDKSPVMMVGAQQYFNVTPESAITILKGLKTQIAQKGGQDD